MTQHENAPSPHTDPAWRQHLLECLARWVIRLGSERDVFLLKFRKRHGDYVADQLLVTMREQWREGVRS